MDKMAASIRQVSSAEVLSVLKYSDLIPQMEKALKCFSTPVDSGVIQPVRSVLKMKSQNGMLGYMPVYCQHDDLLSAKILTVFPENKNQSTHNALIIVFQPDTGIPRAILNADEITEMRTAAVSATASKYLARPESNIMAIIGSGVQARSHFHAISEVFKFKEVRVYSRNFDNAEKLAKEINGRACKTAEEAVKDADIINTATFSPTPVLQIDWVKPGAHINAVGACIPEAHEIDPKIMQSSVIYVDSREAAVKESGDIILGKAEIYAELGEVFLGLKEASKTETTVFKSLGLAIEDGLTAKLVLDLLK